MYLNKAFIIGNLTRDPELKALPSGTKVCNFSIASSRIFKDKDGQKQESTDYHNIAAFGKMGELSAQYLKKGQQALVEGRMQTRSWETNGEKKYRTEIIADNIQFGWKANPSGNSAPGKSETVAAVADNKDGAAPAGTPSESIEYPAEEINPDDIPF